MRYILSPGALSSFFSLREDYQEENKVDLNKTPSMFGTPIILGGTDVVSRNVQTQFIIKMMIVFSANIYKGEDIKAIEQWEANLTASRVIIAACLYIQSQISSPKSHSTLYRLINKNLGITKDNYLDEEDKEICYLAADRVIKSSLIALEQANTALREAHSPPFTEVEWKSFSNYLSDALIRKNIVNPYTNYPVTSITQPMFGAAFAYTGATIGFLGGNIISESTKIMSTKVQLTALIGSTLLVLGHPGPMGIALFSQIIATKLITSFCSFSLMQILARTMGIIGEGVGIGVGLPMDAAYRILWKTCALIGNYITNPSALTSLTGIRICDGTTIIGGIPIQLTSLDDEKIQEYTTKVVEISEDNQLYIDGTLIEIPNTTPELPAEMMAELKEQLSKKLLEKETIADVDEASAPCLS